MRVIHTSDWHLGRSFHQVGLLDAQVRFVDFLVDLVRSEKVGAVLVSGDVYDRALPSPETVSVLADALTRLVDAGAQVVLTSGNHDSAIRLGFAADLLARAGVHIRASVASIGTPVLLGDVAVYPLPYLEPAVVGPALGVAERSHASVLRAAMGRVSDDLATRRLPSVVMAHAFVAGGTTSESEREIAVGGVSVVPADVFDGIGYAALGHLHRPQSNRRGPLRRSRCRRWRSPVGPVLRGHELPARLGHACGPPRHVERAPRSAMTFRGSGALPRIAPPAPEVVSQIYISGD